MRAPLDCALVRGTSIFQTKRHGDITISPERGYESSLYLIFYSQFDLVIASCGIQKRQKLAVGRRINHLINTGQSKRIFGACLVQASVIDTHAPSLVLLHDEDWVCQPLGVKHLHDKACSLQLRNLFADCPSLVLRKTPQRLLTGFEPGRMCNLCSASSLGTPDMSCGDHAKMSRFSRRNSTSLLSYLLLSPSPTTKNLVGSEGSRATFLLSLAD